MLSAIHCSTPDTGIMHARWGMQCAVVPNGTATGLDIGLSNFSLSLITLSFYTMCKSTTPVFLLFFCFAWGLER